MKTSSIAMAACFLIAGLLVSSTNGVRIETVPVGNMGNKGELSGKGAGGMGGDRICGAVDYPFNIGKYEVTAGQYCEFLNAVAKTDTYGLYNTNMWSNTYGCKIQRSGSPGSYAYNAALDWANRPVNWVSYWDACRFANWLHNNQPIGVQDAGTTETGAYTLNGYNGNDGMTIQRNNNWKWAMSSEDEWYKAAYHKNDGVTGNYFDYPTSSNSMPGNQLIDPDPGNNATYNSDGNNYTIGSPYYRTEAGAHENSDSPYGTFDQGGNICEWNEDMAFPDRPYRGLRGGSFYSLGNEMHASIRFSSYPTLEESYFGFRVVQVPEPCSVFTMLIGYPGMVSRRRRAGMFE